ncbi:protein SGT1 homolog [Saccostrea echinata]|uniref:protein SGT1 homolog n=1 Tax=Saccostrea echinata TaxID=191078 RepID=UPI002A7FD63F|nr:protein SGT1 homolog [Saccostrea echinata]
MDAKECFQKANEEFINENFEKALELYSTAIELDGTNPEYYNNRAQTKINIGKYDEALTDTNTACELDPTNMKAYVRKGIALFHLEKFKEAYTTFQAAEILGPEDKVLKTWLRKCEAELDISDKNSDNELVEPLVGVSKGKDESVKITKEPAPPISAPSQPPPKPIAPKTRYDWYQTQTNVVVNVMLKNVKKEECTVDIQPKSLSVTVKLPGGDECNLKLHLAHDIIPEKSFSKVMSTKIEIKLRKSEERQWAKLENDGQKDTVKQFNPQGTEPVVSKYPTSSHYTRNWDKLVTEIKEEEKEEKLEGDAALNNLFQKIYADANDDTKKAMMKSFYESGGTVLSTNWNEVGKQKVEVKPPDGMEHKKWEI